MDNITEQKEDQTPPDGKKINQSETELMQDYTKAMDEVKELTGMLEKVTGSLDEHNIIVQKQQNIIA